MGEPRFELPGKLEIYFATLHKLYEREGKTQLQSVLASSNYHVDEGTHYDNWDGGQHFHDLTFFLPEPLYIEVFEFKATLEERLRNDLSNLSTVSNEHISRVTLDIDAGSVSQDWRMDKKVGRGATEFSVAGLRQNLDRIWTQGFFRLFICHKAEFKKEAAELKDHLTDFGLTGFVAHEDIEPAREWQEEIELALTSMDGMVALMTKGFHESNWTDQELGLGLGRGVPIIAVGLGCDPYGFIGKFQALPGTGKSASQLAAELYQLFLKKTEVKQQLTEGIVTRFEQAENFDDGDRLLSLLLEYETMRPDLISRLENAPNLNAQVKGRKVRQHLSGFVQRLRAPN